MENKENQINENSGLKSEAKDETQTTNAAVDKSGVIKAVNDQSKTGTVNKQDEETIVSKKSETANDQNTPKNECEEQNKAVGGQIKVNAAVRATSGSRNEKKKIFVGGLPSSETDRSLQIYFSRFGEVESVQVKVDTFTGRPRGFAFIEFKTVAACQAALQTPQQLINAKMVEIRPAKAQDFNNKKKLFVGGLPQDLPEDDLVKHFETFGVVEDVEWPVDRMTGLHRSFAFVIFTCETSVNRALGQPKQTIGGRPCDVKKAVPQKRVIARDFSLVPTYNTNGIEQRNVPYLPNNMPDVRPQMINGQPGWHYPYAGYPYVLMSPTDSNTVGPDPTQNQPRQFPFYPMTYDPSRLPHLPPQQQLPSYQNHLPVQEVQNNEHVQFL